MTDLQILILCGGSGSRIDRFEAPKCLYPIVRYPGVPQDDSQGTERILGASENYLIRTDTPLQRLLRQIIKNFDYKGIFFATGYHTEKVLETAKEYITKPCYLDTWFPSMQYGSVSAIKQAIDKLELKEVKVILGDTIWSEIDLQCFLMDTTYSIALYHDENEHQYSETYGLSLDNEGVDIFNQIWNSSVYMQPLSQELGFAGTERVHRDFARIGHFERAIDFSSPVLNLHEKKVRIVASRVLDFDTELAYNMVNARLALGWFG